jgi:hypothetical protein
MTPDMSEAQPLIVISFVRFKILIFKCTALDNGTIETNANKMKNKQIHAFSPVLSSPTVGK